MDNTHTWYKGKRVLVTGGAGFIGSRLAGRLVELGAVVRVADDFSRGRRDAVSDPRIQIVETDLRTEAGALTATASQDVVFNLAAFNTGVDYDVGRTQTMFEENMLLQLLPIRAAAANGVPLFVQVSTASIYSTAAMEERVPTREDDDGDNPEKSKLGYALAKRMGENLARWYAANTKMQTRIARFINVYGPGDHFDGLGHFIPAIIKKFDAASSEIEVFGSGKACRSFLYVDDAVEGLLVIGTNGANGQAYNVDPQDEHSVKDVVLRIQEVMNKQSVAIRWNTSAPEGSLRRMLDNSRITALGWKPTHRVGTETLQEMVADIRRRRHETA